MTETCDTHPHQFLITFCPICRASQGGKAKSEVKTLAARENAKKGWVKRKAQGSASVARRGRTKKSSSASRRSRRSVASR